MTTATSNEYRLVSVYDMREYDWEREEYIPLIKGEGNICERCGREHAKVYVVEHISDGKQHLVGSTCSKKMFGWEPAKDDIAIAAKTMKEAQKKAAQEKYIREIVQPVADSILAMPIPPITFTGEIEPIRSLCTTYLYGIQCGDAIIKGEGPSLSNEDRRRAVTAWLQRRIKEAAKERYPDVASYRQRDKFWESLAQLVSSVI